MIRKSFSPALVALAFGIVVCPNDVTAAPCPVPVLITNGQVADATAVMDNFEAIADCAEEAVTPSGAPVAGEIAIFSGGQTVTGGDLTGDVTTSGGTATTLAPTGVTPGNYALADITVDAAGRITSITSGNLPGSVDGAWTEITLTNPDGETGNTSGWTQSGGGFTATTASPSGHSMTPFEGSYSFTASANANPKMYQTLNISAYATQIDAGEISAKLEASACDTYSIGEAPYIYIQFLDSSDTSLGILISSAPAQSIGSGVWRFLSVEGRVPPLTRSMRVFVWADRLDGTNNNVAFDAVRAFIRGG